MPRIYKNRAEAKKLEWRGPVATVNGNAITDYGKLLGKSQSGVYGVDFQGSGDEIIVHSLEEAYERALKGK